MIDSKNGNIPVGSNVAAGTAVTCSGVESDLLLAANLTDGNLETRWGSDFSDTAWFVIDPGKKL